MSIHSSEGFCPICEAPARFTADNIWFRDHLLCETCQSVPRERALMTTIQMLMPDWRNAKIHEASPLYRGLSRKLMQEAPGYTYSQYDLAVPFGGTHPTHGYRCEDLEHLTYADDTFDLVVTQDVFEHLFDPLQAAREINRVLRPGGCHIYSVPIVLKNGHLSWRAKRNADGTINYLQEPQYHGSATDTKGSLVTIDYGYDLLDWFSQNTGVPHMMYYFDDITRGMRAEFMEIIVARKPGWAPDPG